MTMPFDSDEPDYLDPPARRVVVPHPRAVRQCVVCGADHANGIELCGKCELAYVKEMSER